jgi:hypothetical protein
MRAKRLRYIPGKYEPEMKLSKPTVSSSRSATGEGPGIAAETSAADEVAQLRKGISAAERAQSGT